jgi:arylsulfatase
MTDDWKAVFAQQRARGTMLVLGGAVRADAYPVALQPAHRSLRAVHHHLQRDWDWAWYFDHVYLLVPMQGFVAQFL